MLMRFFFWRNGVVSAAAPRVTTQNSFDSEIKAFGGTMGAESLNHILRTGRTIAADARKKGGDEKLVDFNQQNQRQNQKLFHEPFSLWSGVC